MSYILDALKKAEKERKQGTLPDMLTVQDIVAEKPRKRLAGVYFLAAALVLNAGILVWWLGSSHTAKTKAGQTAVAENTSAAVADKTVQAVPEVPVSPAPAQEASPEIRPVDKNIVPAITVKPVNIRPEAVSDLPKERPDPPDSRRQLVADPRSPGSAAPKPAGISAEKVKQAEGAGRPPSEPANDFTEMPDENKIYKLRELPSAIRQSLPSFSVSALLYSSSPASRMVRVNEQMMREGQELTSGLRLDEIAKEGLVFSYRKYRFFVATK
jgi:general secretion pathway protein B